MMNALRQNEIIVWPLWLRIFHWLLVAAFLVSYLTGDDYRSIHVWSGYLIIGLLLLRIILGLFSSGYASLHGWRCSPRAAMAYLGGLLRGSSQRYLGHNPAGACMSIALILSLSVTLGTGLALHGVHGSGPLATMMSTQPSGADAGIRATGHRESDEHGDDDDDGVHGEDEAEEFWEELHELFVNISLALVILHIIGVLASSWRHGQNLPKSMVTGRKKSEP